MRNVIISLLALVLFTSAAEARHHRRVAPVAVQESCFIFCEAGIRASFSSVISKPARYIAGRLICARNVNSALAERGIKGTGSAMAKSFLGWGRSAGGPVVGAVAVSSRKGGGHVAIVSRIENGTVYVWNPSPRGQGWKETVYRHRAIDFRVAS